MGVLMDETFDLRGQPLGIVDHLCASEPKLVVHRAAVISKFFAPALVLERRTGFFEGEARRLGDSPKPFVGAS